MEDRTHREGRGNVTSILGITVGYMLWWGKRVTMGDRGASVWGGGGGGEVSLSVTGGTEVIQRIRDLRGKLIQFTGTLIVKPLKNIAIEDAIISFGT